MKKSCGHKYKRQLYFKLCVKLCVFILLGSVVINSVMNMLPISVTAEYTEEQKQQAKAWLSAHGYAPTQAGASQAYQDYLNGKFDGDPQVEAVLGKRPTEATTVVTTEDPDQWEDANVDGEDGTSVSVNPGQNDTDATSQATTTEVTTQENTTSEITTTESKVHQIENTVKKDQKRSNHTKWGLIALGAGVVVFVLALLIAVKVWM